MPNMDSKFQCCDYNYGRINTYTYYPKITVMAISTDCPCTNHIDYDQSRHSTNNDALNYPK